MTSFYLNDQYLIPVPQNFTEKGFVEAAKNGNLIKLLRYSHVPNFNVEVKIPVKRPDGDNRNVTGVLKF